jgi:hypothetical protein
MKSQHISDVTVTQLHYSYTIDIIHTIDKILFLYNH